MGNYKKDATEDLKSQITDVDKLKEELLIVIEMKSSNSTNEVIVSLKNEINQSTEKEDLLKLKKKVTKLKKEPNKLEHNANEQRSLSFKRNINTPENPYPKNKH